MVHVTIEERSHVFAENGKTFVLFFHFEIISSLQLEEPQSQYQMCLLQMP